MTLCQSPSGLFIWYAAACNTDDWAWTWTWTWLQQLKFEKQTRGNENIIINEIHKRENENWVTRDLNPRPLERDGRTDGRTLINCVDLTNYVEVRENLFNPNFNLCWCFFEQTRHCLRCSRIIASTKSTGCTATGLRAGKSISVEFTNFRRTVTCPTPSCSTSPPHHLVSHA